MTHQKYLEIEYLGLNAMTTRTSHPMPLVCFSQLPKLASNLAGLGCGDGGVGAWAVVGADCVGSGGKGG